LWPARATSRVRFPRVSSRRVTTPEPGHPKSFVFYEPSGRRWRRVVSVTQGGAILTLLALASTFVGLVVNPELPTLVLPAVPHLLPPSHAHGLTSDQAPPLDAPNARAPAFPNTRPAPD